MVGYFNLLFCWLLLLLLLLILLLFLSDDNLSLQRYRKQWANKKQNGSKKRNYSEEMRISQFKFSSCGFRFHWAPNFLVHISRYYRCLSPVWTLFFLFLFVFFIKVFVCTNMDGKKHSTNDRKLHLIISAVIFTKFHFETSVRHLWILKELCAVSLLSLSFVENRPKIHVSRQNLWQTSIKMIELKKRRRWRK